MLLNSSVLVKRLKTNGSEEVHSQRGILLKGGFSNVKVIAKLMNMVKKVLTLSLIPIFSQSEIPENQYSKNHLEPGI